MSASLQLKRARKVVAALKSPLQARALLRYRVLAGNEHRAVLSRDLRAVVDVGANRGQFALAVRDALPTAQIISFEPLAEPASTYRAIFAGDVRTRLVECAVGAQHQTLTMNISARDDSSSLLAVSEIQDRHYPGTGTVGHVDVEVQPLHMAVPPGSLPSPALLKIDVQGAEFDTLLGCESQLHEFAWIYCECSFVELYRGQRLVSEIVAWLSSRGFDLAGVHNLDRDREGQALQADFLFKARNSPA